MCITVVRGYKLYNYERKGLSIQTKPQNMFGQVVIEREGLLSLHHTDLFSHESCPVPCILERPSHTTTTILIHHTLQMYHWKIKQLFTVVQLNSDLVEVHWSIKQSGVSGPQCSAELRNDWVWSLGKQCQASSVIIEMGFGLSAW